MLADHPIPEPSCDDGCAECGIPGCRRGSYTVGVGVAPHEPVDNVGCSIDSPPDQPSELHVDDADDGCFVG